MMSWGKMVPLIIISGICLALAIIQLSNWVETAQAAAIQQPPVPEVALVAEIPPTPEPTPQPEVVVESNLIEVAPKGECLVSGSYPVSILQWCEGITRWSNSRGLEPNLVAAMMLQESGGDPLAYSSSGAVGLMQVMPKDGIAASFMCKNGPCFTNRPSIEELQNPDYNLEYSTGMMANLISKYGNVRDALKAYGPMDVGYYYADKVLRIQNNNQ